VQPDYLVIGHVCKDVLRDGRVAAGGTVTYSALSAQRLGLQAAVVTACAPKDEALLDVLRDTGVLVHVQESPLTTTFQNSYDAAGNRTQVLSARAVEIAQQDVPKEWLSAPIVHLGPVAQELVADFPSRFTGCLLGVTPQGWMRRWDEAGRVTQSALPVPVALKSLPERSVLTLSMEDLGHRADLVAVYAGLAPLVVITQGGADALVYGEGALAASVPSAPVAVVDPTGAGDVFATSFLVRYNQSGDAVEATRFAHALAAEVIGKAKGK